MYPLSKYGAPLPPCALGPAAQYLLCGHPKAEGSLSGPDSRPPPTRLSATGNREEGGPAEASPGELPGQEGSSKYLVPLGYTEERT